MFTITDEKPENYQLDQGKKILNHVHNQNSKSRNIIVGLEKGSLQSHETNSQFHEVMLYTGKIVSEYGRYYNRIN